MHPNGCPEHVIKAVPLWFSFWEFQNSVNSDSDKFRQFMSEKMTQSTELYEYDFNEWLLQQINLLKQGKIAELDTDHLIAELEDMGKSNLRELESRLIILIAHLLKWQFQPEQQSSSWRGSIREQRAKLLHLFKHVPSLKRHVPEVIPIAYPDALEIALDETGLSPTIFPTICPYSTEQLLDKTFYPVWIRNGFLSSRVTQVWLQRTVNQLIESYQLLKGTLISAITPAQRDAVNDAMCDALMPV